MVAIKELGPLLDHWRRDPPSFFVDALGVPEVHIWPKIREICKSVRDNSRTLVPAGHNVSKTWTAGRLAVWFMICFPPATVITTAPTKKQVQNILWREIRDAVENAKLPLGGKLLTTSWDFQEQTKQKWYALGFATKAETVTKEATAFQGYHNKHVFIIFDEAAGVPNEIWKAADSLFADDFVRFLGIGNPTSVTGCFGEFLDDSRYHVVRVAVTDTPNYIQGKKVIPGVAGREFERNYRLKYGVDHREYKIRVLGIRPDYRLDGAYYAAVLNMLKKQGRFDCHYNTGYPVHTAWDIGYHYSVWFFQQVGQKVNFIRYYEDQGLGVEEMVDVLRRFERDEKYRYGSHFAPFDVDSNAQRAVTGDTIRETAADFGFNFTPIERELRVTDGIERTKKFLRSCWFNRDCCQVGLDCLMSYHERANARMSTEDRIVFTGVPEKDGTDHAADALRYASLAVSGSYLGNKGMTRERWRQLKKQYGY